jgi:ornithine cyclodeaminase
MTEATIPPFAVVSGAQVNEVLTGSEPAVLDAVESAYRLHGIGATVNPPSFFLRFPDRESARIIGLPASVSGLHAHGLKWISSFPDNVAVGAPRASAVLILNDERTGYPFACLESSIISAARTAASAALAARELTRDGDRPNRIGFVGTGLIARYVHTFLAATGWDFVEIGLHDLVPAHITGFQRYLERTGAGRSTVHTGAETLIRSADLLVLTTVAARPHITDPSWFTHAPVVLNISLRDLAPEILLEATNVLDDVEHCLTANTSPHLAEQLTGGRDFITGTLYDVLTARVTPRRDRPVIFSPFGLGVLDLAVGKYVYDRLRDDGALRIIDGFFDEVDRYGRDDIPQ